MHGLFRKLPHIARANLPALFPIHKAGHQTYWDKPVGGGQEGGQIFDLKTTTSKITKMTFHMCFGLLGLSGPFWGQKHSLGLGP